MKTWKFIHNYVIRWGNKFVIIGKKRRLKRQAGMGRGLFLPPSARGLVCSCSYINHHLVYCTVSTKPKHTTSSLMDQVALCVQKVLSIYTKRLGTTSILTDQVLLFKKSCPYLYRDLRPLPVSSTRAKKSCPCLYRYLGYTNNKYRFCLLISLVHFQKLYMLWKFDKTSWTFCSIGVHIYF